MGKYKTKPVIKEAIQFVDTTECVCELSNWVDKLKVDYSVKPPELVIETLEGAMKALPGDYIIKGLRGEFYPCKEDIFLKTYEKVEE